MAGRSPSGRACGPPDLSRDASQPEALVPNAADRIEALAGALERAGHKIHELDDDSPLLREIDAVLKRARGEQ